MTLGLYKIIQNLTNKVKYVFVYLIGLALKILFRTLNTSSGFMLESKIKTFTAGTNRKNMLMAITVNS